MELVNTNTNANMNATENTTIFNPFNPLNKKVECQDIQSILTTYDISYKVNNFALFERAFVHASYTKRPDAENKQLGIVLAENVDNCIPLSTKSNERLEFLGDGVLELIIKYYLYRRFPKADEHFMSNKKMALVKNEAIGKIAYEMGLNKWLLLSNHAEEKKIRVNYRQLGCLFEAFLGAFFLDANHTSLPLNDANENKEDVEEKVEENVEENVEEEVMHRLWVTNVFVTGPGFQIVQKFVENVFEKHVDWTALIQNDDNYKNMLQIKIQKEFKVTPEYKEISYDPLTGYKMGVYLCLYNNNNNNNTNNVHISMLHHQSAYDVTKYNLEQIKNITSFHSFLFLGEGEHKIKKKAEQLASYDALKIFQI